MMTLDPLKAVPCFVKCAMPVVPLLSFLVLVSPSWLRCNKIAGMCWQHSGDLSLTVTSPADVQAVYDAVQRKECHLAAEMTTVAVSGISDAKYSALPIAAFPNCKSGSSASQLQLLTSIIEHWWKAGGPFERFGRLWVCGSDGAAQRRGPLVELFETQPLSKTSSLYPVLSELVLLDLTVRMGWDLD